MGRKNCKHTKAMLGFLKKKNKNNKIFLAKIENIKLPKNILKWKGDYIFCFRSHYILKKQLINKAKFAAINFHPGPPKYRGIGCVNFAIYNNEKKYGLTAHIISEKIDSGPILDVKRFKIKKNDTVNKLLNKTYDLQIMQFKKIIEKLFYNPKNINKLKLKSSNEQWSKKYYKRSDLNWLYKINPNFTSKKINRIIKATNTKSFKPYIEFSNYKFFLQ